MQTGSNSTTQLNMLVSCHEAVSPLDARHHNIQLCKPIIRQMPRLSAHAAGHRLSGDCRSVSSSKFRHHLSAASQQRG
eukprot:354857-Chlamydomonas_euryale.AAC.46